MVNLVKTVNKIGADAGDLENKILPVPEQEIPSSEKDVISDENPENLKAPQKLELNEVEVPKMKETEKKPILESDEDNNVSVPEEKMVTEGKNNPNKVITNSLKNPETVIKSNEINLAFIVSKLIKKGNLSNAVEKLSEARSAA